MLKRPLLINANLKGSYRKKLSSELFKGFCFQFVRAFIIKVFKITKEKKKVISSVPQKNC